MSQVREDFDFILKISQDFFNQEEIVEKLKAFQNLNPKIKGWEIWFQVEFALFLHQHALVSDVEREKRFKVDQRKSKEKITCAIDFFIRQKHKRTPIPLELKQDVTAASCIRHMLKDINKFNKIRCSDVLTNRSLFCLGVHETVSDDHITRLIHENKFFEFDPSCVKTIEIKGTGYSFTIL